MINLNPSKVKTTEITLGGDKTTLVLDTIWIDYMEISRSGSIRIFIKFGTKDPEGNLVETDTPVHATINPDGSFTSDDPKYQGQLDATVLQQSALTALKGFEQAMVSFGLVLGTIS